MKPIFDKVTWHVKLAPKQGKKSPPKDVEEINAMKNICLNCSRPVCKGCGSKEAQFKVKKRRKNES